MTANAAIAVDGYFDLSQLCRDYNRVPANYLTLASTKAKAQTLGKITQSNIFRVKRGRGGRVWAHKAIAPHFLLWLSRETFEPLIDQALLANLEVMAG